MEGLAKVANVEETREIARQRVQNLNDAYYNSIKGNVMTEDGQPKMFGKLTEADGRRGIMHYYNQNEFNKQREANPDLQTAFTQSVEGDRNLIREVNPKEFDLNKMERIQGDDYVRDRALGSGVLGGAVGAAGSALLGNKAPKALGIGGAVGSLGGALLGGMRGKGVQNKDKEEKLKRINQIDGSEYVSTPQLVQTQILKDIYQK